MLLDSISNKIGILAGASSDQIKIILLLFLSLPLSFLFQQIPIKFKFYSILQHLISILPSILYLCFILDLKFGFLQLLLSSLLTYFIIKFGLKNKEGKKMCWKVFTLVMGHLAIKLVLRLPFLLLPHTNHHLTLIAIYGDTSIKFH